MTPPLHADHRRAFRALRRLAALAVIVAGFSVAIDRALGAETPERTRRPNVLLILADDKYAEAG